MPPQPLYRATVAGVETLGPGTRLPRHRHAHGYATVVLAGSFIEASFAGRFRVEPGDVLLHGAFDCHENSAPSRRPLQILRLPWSDSSLEGRFRVRDPDLLARLCERDPVEAAQELRSALQSIGEGGTIDWPEQLAADLSRLPPIVLGQWAACRGILPETLSRGFRRAFGVSPRRFRLEVRARHAWLRLMRSRATLTAIAHELEFADLAHMSRSVRALTGFAPSAWRLAPDCAALLGQLRSSRAT